MYKIKEIYDNKDEILNNLNRRNTNFKKDIDYVCQLNDKRKAYILKSEELKKQRNENSKKIGILINSNNKDEVEKIKNTTIKINNEIKKIDNNLQIIDNSINDILYRLPNQLNDDVPNGKDDSENVEISKHGKILVKDNIAHWEIAKKLDIVDFDYGTLLSGSRFLVYKGNGAKLIRCITNEIIELHNKKGYTELSLPLIVNREIMFGTGQLPKFEEDLYRLENDQFLIPTGEVTLTNIFNNKTINEDQLPLYITTFSQCFRKEAGSAGKDTKGMIRLHQFNKIELVKIVKPETSFDELEKLTNDACDVLELFELPYRKILLCSGDIGFSSTKTYDIEVWFPNQNKYREISSCSNCLSFQAKRMNTKYKDNKLKTIEYVHTLNGSGLAIDRLIAAILENYYDGNKLILPKVLRKYFNNREYI